MARHGWYDAGHAGTSETPRAMQRQGWRRVQLLLCLWLSIEGANAAGGEGKPADLTMNGQPSSCWGGDLNGVWAYQENTADGKGYYKHDIGELVVHLFFDEDADGGGNPSVCNGLENAWLIDGDKPSTTALQDLDENGFCDQAGYIVNPDTSGSLTPPTTAWWKVSCRGKATAMKLSFQPVCAATAYTYAYPQQWTAVNAGCGTGIAQQRTEVESCPARGGCDCVNKRDPRTETEMQEKCATTAGKGKPADLTMSGQPNSCYGGYLNGV